MNEKKEGLDHLHRSLAQIIEIEILRIAGDLHLLIAMKSLFLQEEILRRPTLMTETIWIIAQMRQMLVNLMFLQKMILMRLGHYL